MVSQAVSRIRRLSLSLAISFGAKAVFELASAVYLFNYVFKEVGDGSNTQIVYLVLFFLLTEIWQLIAIMILLRDKRNKDKENVQERESQIENNVYIMEKDALMEE
jgi:hypothetical protein